MTQDCTKSKHLLCPNPAVEATIDPSKISSRVSTDSENVIVRRAVIKEAECVVFICHRSCELGKHYDDFGVGYSCYLYKGYAIGSIFTDYEDQRQHGEVRRSLRDLVASELCGGSHYGAEGSPFAGNNVKPTLDA